MRQIRFPYFFILMSLAALLATWVLCMAPKAQAAEAPVSTAVEEDGRLPGDDAPAVEKCFLTAEELAAQEDYENEKIETALNMGVRTATIYWCEEGDI